MLASLETGLWTVWSSPYRAGLAGRDPKRLPIAPAFTACYGPVWLSPPGKPVTQRPSFRTSPICDGDLAPGDTAHYTRTAATPIASLASRLTELEDSRRVNLPMPIGP